MQKISSFGATLALSLLLLCSFEWSTTIEPPVEKLKWYSWEEAVAANKENPKKIFVDVYTSWCGWCKRMDATTFEDPKVKKYLQENFYPVKLDAEQKAEIQFNGTTFKFIQQGRRGVHTLAYSLLDGQLGYPAFVYLNEKMERIMNSPGYKDADKIMKELTFAAEEHYKKTSWEEYAQKP